VEPKSPEEGAEYVIDRLEGHGMTPDDEIVVRVRWAGYSYEDDTWEKTEDLPSKLVRAYTKRKKLIGPLSDLGLGPVVEYQLTISPAAHPIPTCSVEPTMDNPCCVFRLLMMALTRLVWVVLLTIYGT
jgi:Chromo (CHRromatin Organisation MOdifier) domain